MRICAHSSIVLRRQAREFFNQATVGIEQLFRLTAAQPLLQQREVLRIVSHIRERYLMRAKRSFDWQTVDFARPRPSFRRPQHDRRPLRLGIISVCTRIILDAVNPRVRLIERCREGLMHMPRVRAFDEERFVATRFKQRLHLVIRRTCERGRPGDFISV